MKLALFLGSVFLFIAYTLSFLLNESLRHFHPVHLLIGPALFSVMIGAAVSALSGSAHKPR